MLHAGLDLSRRKVDVCLLSESGEQVDQLAAPPDADALSVISCLLPERRLPDQARQQCLSQWLAHHGLYHVRDFGQRTDVAFQQGLLSLVELLVGHRMSGGAG